jgi:integrase/recombinase XerD
MVLSPEEVIQFLTVVTSAKHRAILTTCYAAGLRISEAIRSRLQLLTASAWSCASNKAKGMKDRYVMLSPKLLTTLRDWWRLERPSTGSSPAISQTSTSPATQLERECQKAHASATSPNPSRRILCGTHLLFIFSSRAPTSVLIQLLLGHRSLATTARYLRIATTKVCSTTSPLDLLPHPVPIEPKPITPQYF